MDLPEQIQITPATVPDNELPDMPQEATPRTDERVRRALMELNRMRRLFSELDLAAALLELARISRDFDTMRRNYTQARESCETAMALVSTLAPGDEQAEKIQERLDQVKAYLDALSERCQPN